MVEGTIYLFRGNEHNASHLALCRVVMRRRSFLVLASGGNIDCMLLTFLLPLLSPGLAPPVLYSERLEIVLCQNGLQCPTRHDWFVAMHHRQVSRFEIEKAQQFWNIHAGNNVFVVRRHGKGEGWLDWKCRQVDCAMFEYVLSVEQ